MTRLLYIHNSMRTSVLRFVAIVVLSLQLMPLGLPLFCDTDRRCDGQMPMSMPSGPTVDQTSNATDCATSVFCAVMGGAALILSTPVSVSASDSYVGLRLHPPKPSLSRAYCALKRRANPRVAHCFH